MRGRAEGATAFGPSMAGASLPKCNFNGAYEKSKSESTPWLPPLLLLLLLLSVSRAAFVVVYVSSGQRRQFARGQFSSFDSCLQCCACVRARVCVCRSRWAAATTEVENVKLSVRRAHRFVWRRVNLLVVLFFSFIQQTQQNKTQLTNRFLL